METHHTLNVLAGAAASVSLLLPFAAHAAGPDRVPADFVPEPRTRPCFIEPAQGYDALDGPVPRCPAP